MHLVNGTGNSPSLGRPTPGVVKQDKSSGGSVDTTKTRSDPQRVSMCSGERPVGAAKGKQTSTMASRQPPPPPPPQTHPPTHPPTPVQQALHAPHDPWQADAERQRILGRVPSLEIELLKEGRFIRLRMPLTLHNRALCFAGSRRTPQPLSGEAGPAFAPTGRANVSGSGTDPVRRSRSLEPKPDRKQVLPRAEACTTAPLFWMGIACVCFFLGGGGYGGWGIRQVRNSERRNVAQQNCTTFGPKPRSCLHQICAHFLSITRF